MNRVLIAASTYGHIRSFHLPYIDRFRELGWEVDLACAGDPNELTELCTCHTVPFEKKMSSPSNFIAARMLRNLIRERKYTLVITHTSLAAFFTRLSVLFLRTRPRVINTVHGYLFDNDTPQIKRLIMQSAELITAPVTDRILTMNAFDYRWASARWGTERVHAIPGMGVSLKSGRREEKTFFAGRSESDFVMIYPAEFSPRKNQAMLIRAMKLLPPEAKLVLPGWGELLEDCRFLAEREGVADRVFFPGFVNGIEPLLKQADAVVSSSRSEGLPFNLMEGMLCSLPVVASRVKGNEDLVKEGETGFLYPFNDEHAFAEKIAALLGSRDEAKRMGENGRLFAERFQLSEVLPIVMREFLA